MAITHHLRLNLFPITGGIEEFRVFRRAHQHSDEERPEDAFLLTLPKERDSEEREDYWIRFEQEDGFEEFWATEHDNRHLTLRALLHSLLGTAQNDLVMQDYEVPKSRFTRQLCLNFVQHTEGTEQLIVQPYYLKAKKCFGWLLDYHFAKHPEVQFSRRVQQLSLSLDKNFKRNLDCYLDRRSRIESYLETRRKFFDKVTMPGANTPVVFKKEFVQLESRRLRSKVYLFRSDQESRSQFNGLRQFGPLSTVANPPHLLFAFLERDRLAARTLAMALQGSKGRERYSFPGFESLFKTELTIDRNPVVLPDFSRESFAKALQTVKSLRDSHPTLVPVFVLPSDDDNGYLEHKAVFANAGIATQVCTLRIINDDYALKWAIANIALQIFCKSGGQPWKVRPTKDRSLIVGISQSHKLRIEDGKSSVEKYFAFSVLTDNSGLYQKIEILGDSGSKHDYLSALKSNLDRILTHDSEGYSQVVLHTSFKIKNDELDQIERAVRDASSKFTQSVKKFAVVKVNHKNRFFGFNPEVNSLVPYEGSVARLGWGEYLLWFEGIFPEKPTVNKAFAGPTHIEFLRGSSSEGIDDNAILQDLVNLSGANWRGFNAKSAPVSVFYCHLVADLVQSFQSHGLPLPKVTDLKPWFL